MKKNWVVYIAKSAMRKYVGHRLEKKGKSDPRLGSVPGPGVNSALNIGKQGS